MRNTSRSNINYLAAAAVLCAVLVFQQFRSPYAADETELLTDSVVSQLHSEEFGSELDSNKIVLLVAEWCGYCRAQEGYFKKDNIPYIKLDVEKSRPISAILNITTQLTPKSKG